MMCKVNGKDNENNYYEMLNDECCTHYLQIHRDIEDLCIMKSK